MISTQTAQVFYAPAAHRRYLTLWGACMAEARGRILLKHPTDRADYEAGDPGWHWSQLPRANELHRRYARLIMREYRKARKP